MAGLEKRRVRPATGLEGLAALGLGPAGVCDRAGMELQSKKCVALWLCPAVLRRRDCSSDRPGTTRETTGSP